MTFNQVKPRPLVVFISLSRDRQPVKTADDLLLSALCNRPETVRYQAEIISDSPTLQHLFSL